MTGTFVGMAGRATAKSTGTDHAPQPAWQARTLSW